jgi:hypothetical protein
VLLCCRPMSATINCYPCSKCSRATRMHYDCFQRIPAFARVTKTADKGCSVRHTAGSGPRTVIEVRPTVLREFRRMSGG